VGPRFGAGVRARGDGGNGGSAGSGAYTREEKGCPFITDMRSEAPRFEAKPSRCFNARGTTALACVRGGHTDGAATSAHTLRGVRALWPRRLREVRAKLTHVGSWRWTHVRADDVTPWRARPGPFQVPLLLGTIL
jgi:hypothetical protein